MSIGGFIQTLIACIHFKSEWKCSCIKNVKDKLLSRIDMYA